MSIHDDRIMAGRATFLHWLSSEVAAAKTDVRSAIEPRLEAGERIRAELPDGTVIGAVAIGKAAETPVVTDERALLAWVKANRPTEVVESVNSAYVEVLKRQAKAHGYAYANETGEVIPGIGLRESSPSYRPTVDKDLIPLLRQRLAEIVAGGLFELPAAEKYRETPPGLGCRCGHMLSDHDAVNYDRSGNPVGRDCRMTGCRCGGTS